MFLLVGGSERLSGISRKREALHERSALVGWKGAEGCGVTGSEVVCELSFVCAAGRGKCGGERCAGIGNGGVLRTCRCWNEERGE